MSEHVTEYYEIKIVRKVLKKTLGQQDVTESQNLIDATVPASVAPSLLTSTAEGIQKIRKGTAFAALVKAVGDSFKEEEAKARAKGEQPLSEMLSGLFSGKSTKTPGNTTR